MGWVLLASVLHNTAQILLHSGSALQDAVQGGPRGRGPESTLRLARSQQEAGTTTGPSPRHCLAPSEPWCGLATPYSLPALAVSMSVPKNYQRGHTMSSDLS